MVGHTAVGCATVAVVLAGAAGARAVAGSTTADVLAGAEVLGDVVHRDAAAERRVVQAAVAVAADDPRPAGLAPRHPGRLVITPRRGPLGLRGPAGGPAGTRGPCVLSRSAAW